MPRVKLSKDETGLMMHMVPIQTATYYEGEIPLEYFHRKVIEITEMNPWLCGRLKSSREHGTHLEHSETVNKSAVLNDYVHVIDDADIERGTSYTELSKIIEMLVSLKTGSQCLNKEDGALFRVSLLKVKGKREFVFALSMNHVIADGYTFYKIYSMFDKDTPITSLKTERVSTYADNKKALLGADQSNMFDSMVLLLTAITTLLFAGSPKLQICSIDLNEIAQRKKNYAEKLQSLSNEEEEDHKQQKQESRRQPISFLSTNDIVTSEIFKLKRGLFNAMPVNLRNRVADITEDLAGNYESPLVYCTEEDVSAEGIRHSVTHFRPVSNRVPSGWTVFFSGVFPITSWATFYTDVVLSGDHPQLLHVPVISSNLSGCKAAAIIFCPGKGKLAFLMGADVDIDLSSFPLGATCATMDAL